MELVSCTCDSQIDCNGQGEAIGSKESGPDCTWLANVYRTIHTQVDMP